MRVAVAPTTKARVNALVRGITAAGDEVVRAGRAPVAVAANWGAALELYEMGYEHVALCECGYLGNRNWWSSVSLDGLNRRGTHAQAPQRPEPPLEPWRGQRDGYALVLGQVPTDWAVKLALGSMPYDVWREEATRQLERQGFEVRYRPHPEVAMLDLERTAQPPSLAAELAGACYAVTVNSTSAIEAICAGVPCYQYDPGCMAWPVAANVYGRAEPPARREWINMLVRLQWGLDELEDGTAWRAFRRVLPC